MRVDGQAAIDAISAENADLKTRLASQSTSAPPSVPPPAYGPQAGGYDARGRTAPSTLGGAPVAVKVQRRNLKELFDTDFTNIRLMARIGNFLENKLVKKKAGVASVVSSRGLSRRRKPVSPRRERARARSSPPLMVDPC